MKILFIGNGNNQLLVNLCKWIKKTNTDWQLDLISDKFVSPEAEIRKYCTNVWSVDDRTFLARIRNIKAVFYTLSLKRLLNRLNTGYDACHIHYFSANYSFIFEKLRKRCRRIIVSVYGSEFYRSARFIKRLQSRVIEGVDKFTFANAATLNDFSKHFNIPAGRTTVCRFGLSVLERLRDINENVSVEEAKRKLGIPPEAVTICCGYNASRGQHHIEVISSIRSALKTERNILLLFPLTYGGDEQYKQSIAGYVGGRNIPAKLFTSFMAEEEVALLRRATDIMINVQPTDQLSGSMQEHFFAGNLVIAGEWLPYTVFDEASVFYRKVASVKDTGDEVKACIENLDEWKVQASGNADKIWELSSWERNIDNWLMLYH